MTEKFEQTYEIPVYNLSTLANKLEKLEKRAVKLGFGEGTIGFEVVGKNFTKLTTIQLGYPDYDTKEVPATFCKVKVWGQSVYIEGWSFIAKIEFTENGNLVLKGENVNVPEEFRNSPGRCDHCNTNRQRKIAYIIKNEDGEYKQVGSTCLKDFFDTTDPTEYASFQQSIWEIFQEGNFEENFGFKSSHAPAVVFTSQYLAYVAQAIEEFGWVSRSDGQYLRSAPTANVASNNYWDARNGKEDVEPPTKAHFAQAEEALLLILEEYGDKKQEELSHFAHNLMVLVRDWTPDGSHLTESKYDGLLAAIFPAKYRIEKERAEAAQNAEVAKVSNYVGEVGKREVFELIWTESFSIGSNGYGETTKLHKFNDAVGNLLVWFSTNSLPPDGRPNEVGDVLTGKCTVKAHSEFEGIKQTVLTRCKLELKE